MKRKRRRKIDLTVKPRSCRTHHRRKAAQPVDSLFPIECKRLPTPDEKDRDKREYVITEPGTTGGIQRFKFGHHGAAHTFAAMIAFVQEHSLEHWVSQVNDWIADLAKLPLTLWSDSDTLDPVIADPIAKLHVLKSRHQRPNPLTDCEMRHLWISMN